MTQQQERFKHTNIITTNGKQTVRNGSSLSTREREKVVPPDHTTRMSKLFSSLDNDDDSHKVAIVDYLAPPTTKQEAPTGARDTDDYYADDMYEGDSECIDGIGDSSRKNQGQDPE